jgi:hypothetical protein
VTDWIQLLGGGLLLYFGAEWFVGGASSLAVALRVPQLVVGLTVVAYGTSAPTRKPRAGRHDIDVLVNGEVIRAGSSRRFELGASGKKQSVQ